MAFIRSIPKKNIELGNALWTAVKTNTTESKKAVPLLLEAGADPNLVRSYTENSDHKSKCTVLHFAVKNKDVALITDLLLHDADPNLLNEKDQTPVELAATLNHWSCVLALANFKQYTNTPKNLGAALWKAVKVNSPEAKLAALALLEAGADLNLLLSYPTNSGEKKATILHIAVINNDPTLVSELLIRGADPSLRNEQHRSPLYLAAIQKNWQCVLAFANHRPLINMPRSYGLALWHAIKENSAESRQTVSALLEAGAETDVTPPSMDSAIKCSVLHLAVSQGDTDTITQLLFYGANRLLQDNNKRTPLESAENASNWNGLSSYASAIKNLKALHTSLVLEQGYKQQGNILKTLPREILTLITTFAFYPMVIKPNHIKTYLAVISEKTIEHKNKVAETIAKQKSEEEAKQKKAVEEEAQQKIAKEAKLKAEAEAKQNAVETKQKIDTFKKIYSALFAGQTKMFKQNFLAKKALLSDAGLLKEIQAEAKREPHDIVAKALELTNIHLNNCSSNNLILMRSIYDWSFQHSGLFKKSTILGTTYFSQSNVAKKIDTLTDEKIAQQIAQDQNSRMAKIFKALS